MRQGGLFYGWVIVACAFTVMMIGFGVAYSFAAFFDDLQREFGASRADVSLIFSISGFLYFSLGAVSGPIADRVGPRGVIACGMLLVGLGLLLGSRAEALWQVYATYGVAVGIGIGFSYVPAIGAVQRWFVERRGFASGLAVTGIGVGTLAMPPIAAWLIDLGGWRGAYVVLGVVALVVGGGAALLIDQSPHKRGLLPDGAVGGGAAAAPVLAGIGLRQALGTGPFWLIFLSAMVTSFGLFIPFVHLSRYAVDHGHSEAQGILMVSLIGVGSILGRFLLGGIADRLGRRRAFVGMFVGMLAVLIWWYLSTGLIALGVFAVLFGTFYGGFVALAPALAADYFGGRNISGIIGFLYSGVAVGTLCGPVLAGVAFDLLGSYDLPILAAAACNIIAVAAIVALRDPVAWRNAKAALFA